MRHVDKFYYDLTEITLRSSNYTCFHIAMGEAAPAGFLSRLMSFPAPLRFSLNDFRNWFFSEDDNDVESNVSEVTKFFETTHHLVRFRCSCRGLNQMSSRISLWDIASWNCANQNCEVPVGRLRVRVGTMLNMSQHHLYTLISCYF